MFQNKSINIILIISVLLFSIKWVLSFYFFKESLSVKIIFESVTDGHFYYPLIKYLAFLELDNSFDPYVKNLKLIPIPIGSIIFHSILLRIFGFAGIIIAEYLAIFLFLFLFYKIFSNFFSRNESILLALFFFIIPSLIKIANIDSLLYLNLFQNEFYSPRVHRPMITSLYFISFIYLLIIMDKTLIFEKKRSIALGLILGFSLSSFYYFFITEFLAISFFLIYKFKSKAINKLIQNYKYVLVSLLVFLLSITPFIINLIYHESDVTERMGSFSLNVEKKVKLIDYYFEQYTKLKFLFILFLSTFCVYFANKKKIGNVKLVNIFYIIFLSAIISPVFFILISPKSGLLYHFNNAIFIWASTFCIIFFVILIKNYFKFNLKPLIINALIYLLISIYCMNFYFEKNNLFNNQTYKDRRIEFNNIAEKLNNNITIQNTSLLTFDNELMVWAILNNIKYLNLLNGLFTSKKHDVIENDLIKNFKFLNLNKKDFIDFLKNEKRGWRYLNTNVASFFQYKYQANSLNTFNNSTNFEPHIKKFILSSSPIYIQQIAIPNEEFDRLEKKFVEYEFKNFREPEFIVLEKLKLITKRIVIEEKSYCKSFSGNIYILYLKNNLKTKCD
jgi:hypothetical protein